MAASPSLPFAVGNSVVCWVLGILALFGWMLIRPRDNSAPKILFLIMGFLALGPVCEAVLDAENAWAPLKFDYFLYHVDKSLGISAFSVARLLTPWQCSILFQVYESLTLALVAWYGLSLKRPDGKPNRLLIAYAVTFLAGPCLYLLLPACGPRHAFGGAFPLGNPEVSAVPVQLAKWPNAIPSLHVSFSLLLVLFAGKSRVLRATAWTYLAGTVLATLAFEHYVIDLVVAVPFACFVARAAEGEIRQAACHLALVLAWMLAIRYATPALTSSPALLRLLACSTVVLAGFSMKAAGTRPQEMERSWRLARCAAIAAGQDGGGK